MAITLSKNLKQKQKIQLTPSLRKSIDLLQLSRFELIKKVEAEIIDNPFLKKIEKNSEYYDGKSFDFDIESKINLRENLLSQLNDLHLNRRENDIAKLIIDCLDECGELVEELSQIEEISNYRFNENEIERILTSVIHKFSPHGIGYRNYKECIRIQIDNKKKLSEKIKKLVYGILENEKLDNIVEIKNSFIETGVTEKDFNLAIELIRNSDLSPGLNFEKTDYIEADLKISLRKNKKIDVSFVNDNFPLIELDNDLVSGVKKELKSSKNKELIKKINDAKWLLTSVNKRNETVQKVGEYICSKQIAFFEDNPLRIQTLSNIEIADEINVHPSTVSRILRHKYVDTPKGLIPLKTLMVSSVSKTRDVSPLQLMTIIKDIINSEKKPKSDKKIAIELNKRGFNLARRTISKYRKKNNIPSSRHR
tara:strand:- start:3137 stop:4405 length:1269 start_codon:yes stop_codon:yes gene_type:complete